jgi:hypothetical protein
LLSSSAMSLLHSYFNLTSQKRLIFDEIVLLLYNKNKENSNVSKLQSASLLHHIAELVTTDDIALDLSYVFSKKFSFMLFFFRSLGSQ